MASSPGPHGTLLAGQATRPAAHSRKSAPGGPSGRALGSTTASSIPFIVAAVGDMPAHHEAQHPLEWLRNRAATEVQRQQACLAAWPPRQAPRPGTYASAAAREPTGASRPPRPPPPPHPTAESPVALSPSSSVVWPRRPNSRDAKDTLTARDVKQIRPGRPVCEWKVDGHEEAFRGVAIVGLGVRAAHEATVVAFETHEPVPEERALPVVRAARAIAVETLALLRALECDRDNLGTPGTALQLVACTERLPWETTEAGVEDPSPHAHLLVLSWKRRGHKDENDMDDDLEYINAPPPPIVSDVRIAALLTPPP